MRGSKAIVLYVRHPGMYECRNHRHDLVGELVREVNERSGMMKECVRYVGAGGCRLSASVGSGGGMTGFDGSRCLEGQQARFQLWMSDWSRGLSG